MPSGTAQGAVLAKFNIDGYLYAVKGVYNAMEGESHPDPVDAIDAATESRSGSRSPRGSRTATAAGAGTPRSARSHPWPLSCPTQTRSDPSMCPGAALPVATKRARASKITYVALDVLACGMDPATLRRSTLVMISLHPLDESNLSFLRGLTPLHPCVTKAPMSP